MSYRDDTLPDGVSIGDVSPYKRLDAIEAASVPMLVRVGWLDAATADGALSRYMASDMAQELVIGAWSHGGEDDVDPFQPQSTYPDPTFDRQFADLVAFFDRHLDETDTSVAAKSIRYYTMNEGRWRTTEAWPPGEMDAQRWYLGPDQTLTDLPAPTEGSDDYAVDTSASSGDATRWQTNLTGGDVYYPDRAEEDAKLLTYTSEPLENAMRITGTPVLSLHLSSTHPDGALHVYLEDVAPDGRVTYLTEGVLRLIHGVSNQAALPYEHPGPPRSFLRADAVSAPLERRCSRRDADVRHVRAARGRASAAHRRRRDTTHRRLPSTPTTERPVLTVVHSPASPSFLELPIASE